MAGFLADSEFWRCGLWRVISNGVIGSAIEVALNECGPSGQLIF